MLKNQYQDLKNALCNGNLYDYISNDGYQFSTYELLEIIKELDYTHYENLEHYEREQQQVEFEQQVYNNLYERGFFEN